MVARAGGGGGPDTIPAGACVAHDLSLNLCDYLPAEIAVADSRGAVVKVNRVLPRPASDPLQAQQELAQYTRAWATAEAAAYYEMLKDRYKARIKVPQPAPETAAR